MGLHCADKSVTLWANECYVTMEIRIKTLLTALISLHGLTGAAGPVEMVDTRVGTAAAETRTAGLFGKGSEEHGQTLPSVGVPHGMNLWTPQTRDTEQKCIAPYYYADTLLQGFRNSHWLVGGCTQDYGSMTLHAMGGKLRTSPEKRATPFSHSTETARPDLYAVTLPAEGMRAEMAGLSRAGMFRFTYDADGTGHLVVNPNSDEGVGSVEVDLTRREIRGHNPVHRIYQGWGEPAGYAGWFVITIPEGLEITDAGTFRGDSVMPGRLTASNAPGIGAYISYRVKKDVPVTFAAASSFTSAEGARANLRAEIPQADFEAVRAESRRQWEERLGLIRVEGGKEGDAAKFYGSLWRSSLLPRVTSDADGSYSRFGGGGETMRMPAGHDYYDDYSMWDTYRALHPLLTLLTPSRSADMMQSLVCKAQQGGWMPIFPCWGSYTAAMIGDHCAAAIADAAVKGIDGFDLEEAYRYLRRNAFESPATYEEYADGMGRRALESYMRYGYLPLEDSVPDAFHKREQTSRTLEYAYDDFALSQLAALLGHNEDARALRERSANWRNVIDPRTGYACGRHADGTFDPSSDPFSFSKAITEGAPCHYTWYVPHDPDGLVEALGGSEAFEAKLDSMFDFGRYWHGNEPCHQVAYMYDAVGRPDKAAQRVRHILDTEYLDTPGGLSGNDDAGQMSAWFVFSAMGFYPVCPGKPEYWTGAPLFDSITLTPEGGRPLRIVAPGASEGRRFTSVTLNGKAVDPRRLSHSALVEGGELRFD